MASFKEFMKKEVSKPLHALKETAVLTAKLTALFFFRLFLWLVFFLTPIIFFFALSFHWATGKMKKEIEEVNQLQSANQRTNQFQPNSGWNLPGLSNLSNDVDFWLRQYRRFKS